MLLGGTLLCYSALYYVDSLYEAVDQYGNPKVWERFEFDDPAKKGKSTITDILWAIDCVQKRIILLEIIQRKTPTDSGKVVKASPSQKDWLDLPPGTHGEYFLKTACKMVSERN